MAQTVHPHATHVVIGDTQVKDGVPTANLSWIGQYIADQFWGKPNVKIIHLGDHPDLPSLSSYDKGKKSMEGRRYRKDVDSSNAGWDLLNEPILDKTKRMRRPWNPGLHYLRGNHDDRVARAVESDATLEGVIGFDDFNFEEWGWQVHPFLEVLELDGVAYSHYFYHPRTGKPYGGENLLPRLKTIGRSFTMGHQQGRDVAERYVGRRRHMGLVLGSSYIHEEKYLGPQGNYHWSGIMVCHRVHDGEYDRMEVSLPYLCERYEGIPYEKFLKNPH